MIEYENLGLTNKPFHEDFLKNFRDILEKGWFILGRQVSDFEEAFAAYCNTSWCAGVGSGLDALVLSMMALGIPRGSEVIVPSNTYFATILAIIRCGLKPVLVEPDIQSYNINTLLIEQALTKKTRCLLVVHLYGKVCDMDPILSIARRYDLTVVEDCAQAHGAEYKHKKAGSFGHLGAWSFYPTKNLGALGDAGAVTSNLAPMIERIKILRNYGSSSKGYNDYIGVNSRLDEIQASFLLVKLKSLDIINEHKRRLAALYSEYLKPDFIKPIVHPDYYDIYHIYNIRHPQRDKIRDYLTRKGIMTRIHYPVPPHKQKALKGFVKGDYPVAALIHDTTLSLPVSFHHTEDDVFRIIDALNKY
jgi:dTDP-4-amino-4,6-dideoxygalactose transaminase